MGALKFGAEHDAERRQHCHRRPNARILIAKARMYHPFPMAPVTVHPAEVAYELVLAHAGACLPRRTILWIQRAVDQTRTGKVQYKQGIITDTHQVGGYPEYTGGAVTYTQNDGIPDSWKQKYGLDIHDPNLATKDCNGDGYTNIEKYLDGLDPTKKIDWKDLKNNVNPLDTSERRRRSLPCSNPAV